MVLCPICHRENETITHLVWNYPTSNDVWTLTGYHKWPKNLDSIYHLLMKMHTIMTKVDLELSYNILRQIWSHKNNMVFKNHFSRPQKLVCIVKDELEDYQTATGIENQQA